MGWNGGRRGTTAVMEKEKLFSTIRLDWQCVGFIIIGETMMQLNCFDCFAF